MREVGNALKKKTSRLCVTAFFPYLRVHNTVPFSQSILRVDFMHITDMLHCSYSSEEARNDVPLDWDQTYGLPKTRGVAL